MINDRPKHLLDQDDYKKLPAEHFAVDFATLPELVRKALGPLGGIQLTGEMAQAANGELHDMPSESEIKLFKEKGTLFQAICLILSIAHLKEVDGTPVATPYALSLMPTSKRDMLDEKGIDLEGWLVHENPLPYGLTFATILPIRLRPSWNSKKLRVTLLTLRD